jgi:hypothetical protein
MPMRNTHSAALNAFDVAVSGDMPSFLAKKKYA